MTRLDEGKLQKCRNFEIKVEGGDRLQSLDFELGGGGFDCILQFPKNVKNNPYS